MANSSRAKSSPKLSPSDGAGNYGVSSIRILVVEDFEPFRRFISVTLGKRPELHVICEVSDGLEAIHKAEELLPDLIVLDIGLPKLNGIEAARQIRKLSPTSKIIFLTQECSAGAVQEALRLGAVGYVVKTLARSKLLSAVDAVLQDQQFVGCGLAALDTSDTTVADLSNGLRRGSKL